MARPKLEQPHFRLVRRGRRFAVRWWQDGRWHRVSAGTEDEREALRFLNQWAAGYASPQPPRQPLLSAILNGYLADRRGRVASYATLAACCMALKRHLGDLEPAHLTLERSRFYLRRRRAEGHLVGPAKARRRKTTSDGTVLRELVTLRAALRWAVRERWIAQAPYVEVPRAPTARDRWLKPDEADRLLAAAREPHMRVFIALALHTAARRGALLELTWEQVDLEGGTVTLRTGTGNKRRPRLLPINDRLRAVLVEARAMATCAAVVEYDGGRVASVATGFRAACRRAGLEGVTPHTLRHTAATWMTQAGRPLEEVAAYLGDTVATIERVYVHHAPGWLRDAAAALEQEVSGPLAPLTRRRKQG